MNNIRKVIILNDDINSARAFLHSFSSEEFYKLDAFENLRDKDKWTFEEIKADAAQFFEGSETDEILILDIELETSPQDGIAFLQWFRQEGYTQPVFIYSGHISRLESVEEARKELAKLGLSEDLVWSPVIDSELKDIEKVLRQAKNITDSDLIKEQYNNTIPWRYEYFQEISLRLLIFNRHDIQEIKEIVGLDEQNITVEGRYEKLNRLNETEKEVFHNIKSNVSRLLEMPSGTNFFNNTLFSRHYMNIYKALANLCKDQMRTAITNK